MDISRSPWAVDMWIDVGQRPMETKSGKDTGGLYVASIDHSTPYLLHTASHFFVAVLSARLLGDRLNTYM